jgi:hypothetical protein
MDTADVAASLRALADRVRRLVPHRRDPERFHVDKSCITQDLEELAAECDGIRPETRRIGVPSRLVTTTITTLRNGRRVQVQHRQPFAIHVEGTK